MPKIIGTHKICKVCNETKLINEFPKALTCNKCILISKKQYYLDNVKLKQHLKHPNHIGRPRKI